jgi:HEAT repeat protein
MTGGHGEKISRKQEAAIQALLTELTVLAAAKKAGLGEKTLRRWLQVPAFSQAYRVARQKQFDDSLANLRAASQDAVETLRKALADPSGPLRVRAASAILDLGFKSQLVDLAERIERLEKYLLPEIQTL